MIDHFQNLTPFVRDGELTVEAILWLATLVDAINAQEAAIEALTARVEALEA